MFKRLMGTKRESGEVVYVRSDAQGRQHLRRELCELRMSLTGISGGEHSRQGNRKGQGPSGWKGLVYLEMKKASCG